MAYNRWIKKDGQPWFSATERRHHKRFQKHVRTTTTHPERRISREPCFVRDCATRPTVGEAHHPDPAQPFKVLWVCLSHHRMVDHGSLRFAKTDLWDYSSLINQRPRAQKPT